MGPFSGSWSIFRTRRSCHRMSIQPLFSEVKSEKTGEHISGDFTPVISDLPGIRMGLTTGGIEHDTIHAAIFISW